MQSPVKLYLRVRLPDGVYPYLKPAFTSNGRIRPHYAMHKGRATHFPGSTYYLRFQVNGKRVWEPVGEDSSIASVSLQRKALGLCNAETDSAPVSPQPSAIPSKRPLSNLPLPRTKPAFDASVSRPIQPHQSKFHPRGPRCNFRSIMAPERVTARSDDRE